MRNLVDIQKIAGEHNWKLNPDIKVVNNVIKGQNLLFTKLGKYYCPCKIKRTDENVCPCKDSKAEIERDGHCHCLLFFK